MEQVNAAEKIRTQLLVASNKLATDENKLKTAQQAEASEKTTIQQAVTGAFNIASAASPTGGTLTGAAIQAQAAQAANAAKVWAAGINKLRSEHLATSLIAQLAQGGPGDLAQVQALLQLNPAGIASINSSTSAIAAVGASLGTTVATALYGGQVAADKKDVSIDEKSIAKLATAFADDLDKRQIVIKIDGKQVFYAVEGARRRSRR